MNGMGKGKSVILTFVSRRPGFYSDSGSNLFQTANGGLAGGSITTTIQHSTQIHKSHTQIHTSHKIIALKTNRQNKEKSAHIIT
jgi:hypothetical protein